jgi:hypothetical protein
MVTAGLVLVGAAVVCAWVFVGTTARADARAGAPTRVSRRSGGWLAGALVLVVVGVGLLIRHVVGLWL